MEQIGAFAPLIGMVAIFYFLIIRPQQKQAKQHKEMIENLKKGDKVISNGGFIAEVTKVEEEFFKVKLNNDTEVKLSKEFVARKFEDEN